MLATIVTGLLLAAAQAVAPTHADYALPIRDCSTDCRSPRDAIELAAAAAPVRAPTGYYRITVRTMGTQGDRFYINSERDYRDQRNISLSFDRAQARRLIAMVGGGSIEEALVGRELVVFDRPERVRIHFIGRGGPTRLYYYQNHIEITDAHRQLFRPVV